jgi:hypothetical protein
MKRCCDLCLVDGHEIPAVYDARLPKVGCWADVCEACFKAQGCKLGLGCGSKL